MLNLVTGGAGFIGANLIYKLIGLGEDVICVDNLSTGQMSNLDQVINNPKFTFINHDLTNPLEINIDKIWHLACPASPKKYQEDPIQTSKTCFLGTINMLELARKNNARFLFTSSSEVYGNPKEFPQSESYLGASNTIGKRSCYTEGKRIAESLCFDYYRKYDLDVKVARIFNTYGPKLDKNDGRLISNLIMQAIFDDELTIYGDGSQTRSFCYIDDLIDGLIKLMNFKETLLVNLGSQNEIKVIEIANLVIDLVNSNSNIINLPLPEDDPQRRNPNINLAISKLKWYPIISIEEGLKKTIAHLKRNVDT